MYRIGLICLTMAFYGAFMPESTLYAYIDQKQAYEGIVIHITDSNQMSLEDCDNWHNARGWNGCGYNFVIDKEAGLYDARGFNKTGAHTLNKKNRIRLSGRPNESLIGVAFVTKDRATKDQLETFRAWIRQHGLEGLPLYGHNQFQYKRCPGSVLKQIQGET